MGYAVVLPVTISLTLHQVLRYTSLTDYDAALRRALRGSHATAPRAPPVEMCTRCALPRPERTHHCRDCGRCTPRMSHHRGVLGLCVGAQNYKPFVQPIAQGAVATTLLAWYCFQVGAARRLLGHRPCTSSSWRRSSWSGSPRCTRSSSRYLSDHIVLFEEIMVVDICAALLNEGRRVARATRRGTAYRHVHARTRHGKWCARAR